MTIVCPYQDCQQQLAIEAQHAGSEANCPTCRRPMQLPELSAFPVEEVDPAPWAKDEPAANRTPENIPDRHGDDPPNSDRASGGTVSPETARVRRTDPTPFPPQQNAAELSPEDLVSSLISRSAHEQREPSPDHRLASQESSGGQTDSPRNDAETTTTNSGGNPDSRAASSTGIPASADPERPFTPGGGAGCPHCMHAFDDDAQEFVRELVELRETGIGVGKIGVKCACGAETEFENLLWIKNGEPAEPHPASGKRVSRPGFRPPNSRRDRAKIFSAAGFAAVKRGNPEVAHAKWLQATEADQSWSIPFFNLARLSLDQGDRHAAIAFLDMAENCAREGSSEEDAQVIKQLPFLKSRLEVKA